MNTLGQRVADFLDKDEIRYRSEQRNNIEIFLFTLGMKQFDLHVTILCENDIDLVLFLAEAPVKIPREKRLETMRLISRINFHTRFGALCLDEEDGQLIARTALNTDDDALTHNLFRIAWHTCATLLDDHLNEILTLVYQQEMPGMLSLSRDEVAC